MTAFHALLTHAGEAMLGLLTMVWRFVCLLVCLSHLHVCVCGGGVGSVSIIAEPHVGE